MSRASTPACERPASPSHMRDDELRREYVQLRGTLAALAAEERRLGDSIEALREESVRFAQSAEVEEECVTNRLLRRLKGVERDVSQCADALHDEERAVHETARQIRSVRAQQAVIERQLEEQQGAQLYELQKKLMSVTEQKSHVEHELYAERQRYLEMLLRVLVRLRGGHEVGNTNATTTTTTAAAATAATDTMTTEGSRHGEDGSSSGDGGDRSTSSSNNNNNKEMQQQQQQASSAVAVDATTMSDTPCAAAATSNATTATTTQTSADVVTPDVHQKIVQLEQRLNRLLQEQAAAMHTAAAHERRCEELTAQLRQVQMDVFLKRAKATKLKDDLREASAQLRELGDVAPITNSSFAGAELSFCVTPNTSLDGGGGGAAVLASDPVAAAVAAVRERTRELLTATPTPPGAATTAGAAVHTPTAAVIVPPLPASFAEAMHLGGGSGNNNNNNNNSLHM